jgi:hypothetical protein
MKSAARVPAAWRKGTAAVWGPSGAVPVVARGVQDLLDGGRRDGDAVDGRGEMGWFAGLSDRSGERGLYCILFG